MKPAISSMAIAVATSSAILLTPLSAYAGFVNTSGSARLDEPVASIGRHAWESDFRTRAFQEQDDFTAVESFVINISASGECDSPEDYTSSTVLAGTVLDSYLIHQDARGALGNIVLQSTFTFDAPIMGLIVDADDLAATDGMFGRTGVDYGIHDPLRGLDFPGSQDCVNISEDRMTLTLTLQTQVAFDHIRVITAAVPAPGALALLGVAGLLRGRSGRRRR